jgi:hypothetical protein
MTATTKATKQQSSKKSPRGLATSMGFPGEVPAQVPQSETGLRDGARERRCRRCDRYRLLLLAPSPTRYGLLMTFRRVLVCR